MRKVKSTVIEIKQGIRAFYLTKLSAKTVTTISYAAIRNQSDEEGAVQRLLNPRRVSSIKEFTLAGGDYPSAFVLNWVSPKNKLKKIAGALEFSEEPNSCQIIDGQHRIEGIRSAIEADISISKLELPVVIYQNLTTQECADIFLSINTEQKPVPRSLVFDLYGIASEQNTDPAAVRARDIAIALNELSGSSYEGCIKLPNSPKKKGGIALSTAINAIRPLVEEKGVFEQVEIPELQMQQGIINNLFSALEAKYGESWWDSKNVFMYAAGFIAAMDFLKLVLIPFCNTKGSYTQKTIEEVITIRRDALIMQDEVKGLSGGDATARVYKLLKESFNGVSKGAKSIEY